MGSWAEAIRLNKGFMLVTTAAIVIVVALLPFAQMYDSRVARGRPLYEDRARMARLQSHLVQQQGSAMPVTVAPGQKVTVGDGTFTASAGTTVSVKVLEHAYCVSARNARGDRTGWRCWTDTGTPPPSRP
ncbi:MAG: hypothetical protein QOK15_3307 [Nocardioidaceae bacterium]|jgi:hypothetical protein|nr:hypothetical protein [Nocardioidaceae bacterium]